MLKWPERHGDQRERPAQVKRAHVGLDELYPALDLGALRLEPLAAHGKHLRRCIEANDVDTGAGGRDEDASRAAADFENRTAGCCRRIDKERDIGPLSILRNTIVQIRGGRVLVVCC